ncbi:hypothetical protein Mal4_35320 [Maioricimonas rarisocia]|uniref:Uncharacterized protein n=1 Tax=Maioricimonas rarisocia TaxID=2528026 RepID=A0A517Z9N0_9PLAN|nr:hypothetical protein [Maioricimonas rarisocia]QDU39195.1 hypothetical protein Mal4_35320 [Maioricimonas rarisocia]
MHHRTLRDVVGDSGESQDSDAWRRLLGGRARYNRQRQQIAESRREAILMWLLRHRKWMWCVSFGEFLEVDRIIVRHGDAAAIARALGVGRATVCRDLSALQATEPWAFGSRCCRVDYADYMAGWRYAHRHGWDNVQPDSNLRFAAKQNGPRGRVQRAAAQAMGPTISESTAPPAPQQDVNPSVAPDDFLEPTPPPPDGDPTDHFIRLLEHNCAHAEKPKPPRRVPAVVTG